MLDRLIGTFQEWRLKRLQCRLMKNSITSILKNLYSETVTLDAIFDVIECDKQPAQRLCGYVAIITATQLDEPLTPQDITDAVTKWLRAEHSKDFLSESDFATVVHLHRELAEICWLHKTQMILNGKLASVRYKNMESYSDLFAYDAAVYNCERSRKGPLSQQERDKWKHLSSQLQKAQAAIDNHLDEHPSPEAPDEGQERRQRRIQLLTEASRAARQDIDDYIDFIGAKAHVERRLEELDKMASSEALNRTVGTMVQEVRDGK